MNNNKPESPEEVFADSMTAVFKQYHESKMHTGGLVESMERFKKLHEKELRTKVLFSLEEGYVRHIAEQAYGIDLTEDEIKDFYYAFYDDEKTQALLEKTVKAAIRHTHNVGTDEDEEEL